MVTLTNYELSAMIYKGPVAFRPRLPGVWLFTERLILILLELYMQIPCKSR